MFLIVVDIWSIYSHEIEVSNCSHLLIIVLHLQTSFILLIPNQFNTIHLLYPFNCAILVTTFKTMSNINIENQLRDFQSQRFPTDEQTIINNASVLYKRKKYFLQDLRSSVKFLGFILLGIVYLRDLSMLRLGIRAFTQYSISNPYPTPSMRVSISEESKKALTKFLLIGIFSANSFCLLMHLLFGSYQGSDASNGFLHGGMTIQFIGERAPYSTLELILLDIGIFVVQVVYHSLMCMTDDSKVLEIQHPHTRTENTIDSIDDSELEGDGYNGNVQLLTIDVLGNIRKVMMFKERFQIQASTFSEQAPEQAPQPTPQQPMPGSFV